MINDIAKYVESVKDEVEKLTLELCAIPAPSGNESLRAEFCKARLKEYGAKDVYIDEALNVVCPFLGADRSKYVLFSAHSDVVFPDLTPLPVKVDSEKIYSPGCGDDTVCVAILLTCARYLIQANIVPPINIIIAINSCEEGLGNLKGIKHLINTLPGKAVAAYTLDGKYDAVVNRCVGSNRYKVTVKTVGGHSFNNFGNASAIGILSSIISDIYKIKVPTSPDTKTTYNVGTIEGGTSVNTIAQSCSMLCEVRSDDAKSLNDVTTEMLNIIKSYDGNNCTIDTELIGVRPCMGDVDMTELNRISDMCAEIQQKHSGKTCGFFSGSTDCNIPLSLGIPAICVGVYDGGGAHTREEYLIRSSIPVGLAIALELIFKYC